MTEAQEEGPRGAGATVTKEFVETTPEEREKWTRALELLERKAGSAGSEHWELTRNERMRLAHRNELRVLACVVNPREGTIAPLIQETLQKVTSEPTPYYSNDLRRILETVNEAFQTCSNITVRWADLGSRDETAYGATVGMNPRVRDFILSTIPVKEKRRIFQAAIGSAGGLKTYISEPQQGVTAKIPYPADTVPLYQSAITFLKGEMQKLPSATSSGQ